MSSFGQNFKVNISGTAHGSAIYVSIDGVPEGITLDEGMIYELLSRRSPKGVSGATSRIEPDLVIFEAGVKNGMTTGQIIRAKIENKDVKKSDYDNLKLIPRPGHSDYAAIMKDGRNVELSGGGRFSGRLTAALCVAGGIAKQLLLSRGIEVSARLIEAGGVSPDKITPEFMESLNGDSIGGVVECTVTGLKAGSCGDSYFDGLEGKISYSVFAIPAVKAVEFGSGFSSARMKGSENNDEYEIRDGRVEFLSNNCGGILGGIATGTPLILRAYFKPTPSISLPQRTVDLDKMENTVIEIKGRHDSCIALRASAPVESSVAIAVLDALMGNEN